eukprot:COSAG03_NODE_360_length_8585_cov_69.712350_5_plen_96_part_00
MAPPPPRVGLAVEAKEIDNTPKPTCYLHNLALSNNIANVYTGDRSNQIVLQTGSSALKFHAGSTSKPWIGIKYHRTWRDNGHKALMPVIIKSFIE